MKKIATIAALIFDMLIAISAVWVVVEFIIYLVKDIPFNWSSVWALSISFALALSTWVVVLISWKRK